MFFFSSKCGDIVSFSFKIIIIKRNGTEIQSIFEKEDIEMNMCCIQLLGQNKYYIKMYKISIFGIFDVATLLWPVVLPFFFLILEDFLHKLKY
jgi:hypothetical protein